MKPEVSQMARDGVNFDVMRPNGTGGDSGFGPWILAQLQ